MGKKRYASPRQGADPLSRAISLIGHKGKGADSESPDLKAEPFIIEKVVERAREHWRSGEYQVAERLLRRAAEKDPTHHSQTLLGEFLLATSFPAEAEEIFEILKESHPHNPEFLVLLARSMADQDRFSSACRVLKEALEIDPTHAEGLNLLADIGLRTNRTGVVIERLNRLAEEHARSSEPHLVLSKIYERLNRFDQATDAVRRGLHARPNDARLLNRLGILHFRLGRHDAALCCYDLALESTGDPDCGPSFERDRHILVNRANALCMVGRMDESIELYQRLLDDAPDDCTVAVNMAISLRKTGRLGEARRVLEGARHENSQSRNLLYWLGVLAAEDNSLHDAEQYLRKALTLDSDDSATQMQLACVLKRQGRADEALAAINDVVFLSPDRDDALQIQAEILLDLNRLDEAEVVYQKLLDRYPEDPLLCQRLGTVKALAGRLTDAGPLLKQALESDPRNKGLYLDIAQIALLDGNRTECLEILDRGLTEGVLDRNEIRACAGLDEIKDSDRYRILVGGSLLDFADPWNDADKRLGRLIDELPRSSADARARSALWRELGCHGTLQGDAAVVVRQILREVSSGLILTDGVDSGANAHVEVHPIGKGLEIRLVLHDAEIAGADAEIAGADAAVAGADAPSGGETVSSQALFRKSAHSYVLRFQNQEPTII